jgi:hypothetical protein
MGVAAHMDTNARFVELERRTRGNLERSALIIEKAEALIERSAAILRDAVRVNPKFRRVRNAVCKPEIKRWLLATASVIRDWGAMPREEIDSTMAAATPAEAAAYIVHRHVPLDLRADVLRALPRLTQYSFHHAAWQIRQAAFQNAG